MLSPIKAVLALEAPVDPRGALRRSARAMLLSRIEAIFARAAPAQQAAGFWSSFQALPAASRRRVLDAPSVWGRVLQDLESDVAPFEEAVAAELLRLGQRPDPSREGPVWTALGDLCFPDGAPEPRIEAPTLPQGAVIDADSPHATARIPNVIARFSPFDAPELSETVTRLRAAARALPRICANANRLVTAFGRTIVLRRDEDAPDRFLSESTEGVIGRVLLCNPHLETVGPLDLIEALVHESTHSFLSTVELFRPFIPDREAAGEIALISPWTGYSLDAERLVHASLVWFTLAALWSAAARSDHPICQDRGELSRRQRAAERGLGELPALLPELRPALSTEAADLLQRLASQLSSSSAPPTY